MTGIPELAFARFKAEWTPEAIAVLRRNATPQSLAKLIYETQSSYTGFDHEKYSTLVMAYLFEQMIVGLATAVQPEARLATTVNSIDLARPSREVGP